ncbi:hypothetical protein [Ktedonospora formicarum]|uniref:TIR domain-containing protein n=1 Tax=Ktedonospora formicarum TaxID=2778364 RepID=A0A8J3HWA8_9CHLR|nr:hypothetical protein [Ktedonospora formicarum]GHO44406.1 hypothetical protein KSX_25690 [Ktedonospora formicarum]
MKQHYNSSANAKQLTLLCCYAAEDQEQLSSLKRYFVSLSDERVCVRLATLDMDAASLGLAEASVTISEAHIILLLVSDAFKRFGDDKHRAMEHILNSARHGDTRVFPVVLRKTRWAGTSFSILRPLPANGAALQTRIEEHFDASIMAILLNELRMEMHKLADTLGIAQDHPLAHTNDDVRYAYSPDVQAVAEDEKQREAMTDELLLLPTHSPIPQSARDTSNKSLTRWVKVVLPKADYALPRRRIALRHQVRRSVPRVVIVVVVVCLTCSLSH